MSHPCFCAVRYRAVLYCGIDGGVKRTRESYDYEEVSHWIDEAIERDEATGGDVEEFVPNIGWVMA